MKLVFTRHPLRQLLRWSMLTLLAAGVTLLVYCAFVLVDAQVFQRREQHTLERQIASSPVASPSLPPGLIGRIEIPRLDISVIVMEGTSEKILRRAAGHIAGTALPGDRGNVGLSAHRDTFFRPLRNVRRNDIITLTTALGEYRYRVLTTRIVLPSDLEVLNSDGHEILTLVTCYPFYFIGPAPKRFIVRAERVV